MKQLKILVIIVLFVFLSACEAATQTPTESTIVPLNFSPKMTMYEEGKVQFDLGVNNDSDQRSDAIKDANIRMIVTNEEGKIQNQMTLVEIPEIGAGETEYPLIYEAVYEKGSYTLSMTGKGIDSLSVDFEIREIGGVRKLAAPGHYIDPVTEFTVNIPD